LRAADQLSQKSGTENIPVFLVLAIILLAAHVFSSQRHLLQENSRAAPATDAGEKYVWLTGFPEIPEGLYLFTEQLLETGYPEIGSLPAWGTGRDEDPIVAAIQYDAAISRPVPLPPPVANIFFQPISINRADADILTSLPGIGPVLAARIIQRREEHGPFRSKDELLRIAGIGPKKYSALVERITLD